MTLAPDDTRESPVQPYSERLQDSKEYVRLGAVAELLMADVEMLPSLETVVPCLDDASNEVRQLAVELLLRFGPGAAPALTHALSAMQSLPVRIAAASALARLGPEAEPAIEPLCRALQAEDPKLCWHASFALGKIGPAAVPPLRLLLQSSDSRIVAAALDSLEWIGPGAKEAQGDVEKLAAETPSPTLRLACATALVKLTDDAAIAQPILVQVLEKGEAGLRKGCIQRIAGMGASGGEYGDCLLRACGDPSGEVRAAAALALATVMEDPSAAVPALTELLSDPEPEVRANAAMGLARYGSASASALPRLREMQQGPDERPAAVAGAAIEKIEPKEA
jgi:HEAT repeat protein